MHDHFSHFIFYNTCLTAFVLLLSPVGVTDCHGLIVDRAFEFLFVVMFHQGFPCLVIRCRDCSHQRTAVFPRASVESRLPLVFFWNWDVVFHVVGIFVSIEIHAVFFFKRIFDSIPYKEQGKMKMFFFMMSISCIRTQGVCFESERDRNLGSAKVKFTVQFPVKCADLCGQYCSFFL